MKKWLVRTPAIEMKCPKQIVNIQLRKYSFKFFIGILSALFCDVCCVVACPTDHCNEIEFSKPFFATLNQGVACS